MIFSYTTKQTLSLRRIREWGWRISQTNEYKKSVKTFQHKFDESLELKTEKKNNFGNMIGNSKKTFANTILIDLCINDETISKVAKYF